MYVPELRIYPGWRAIDTLELVERIEETEEMKWTFCTTTIAKGSFTNTIDSLY